MNRYRVNLGRTQKPFSELVWADNAKVNDHGQLFLMLDGRVVAVYRQGGWDRVRVVDSRD